MTLRDYIKIKVNILKTWELIEARNSKLIMTQIFLEKHIQRLWRMTLINSY